MNQKGMKELDSVDMKIWLTEIPSSDLDHVLVSSEAIDQFWIGCVDNTAMILDDEWVSKAFIAGVKNILSLVFAFTLKHILILK